MLVDLSRTAGMCGIRDVGDELLIGAMTTHYQVMTSELVRRHCGLLAKATATVADPRSVITAPSAVRCRTPIQRATCLRWRWRSAPRWWWPRPVSATRPAARESTAPDGERAAAVPQQVAGPQAADSLDLFSAVALPMARRFAPMLAGMVLGVAAGALFGGRRRVVIVIPQPPHRLLQRAGPTM